MSTRLSTFHLTFNTLPFSPRWLRIALLLLFFVNLTYLAAAQTKVWQKTFGGLNDDTYSTSIATPDGGYLFGGSSLSGIGKDKSQAGRGDSDFWIVKTDVNGNKKWDKRFGGSRIDVLKALIATSDGGYLLGGTSTSPLSGDKSQSHHGNINVEDYWVVKIDANGNKQWDKTFGGDGYDQLTSLAAISDGGYLLAGSSSTGIKGIYDYWVVKINSSGGKVWDKYYGGSSYETGKVTIVAATGGGYLLGGSSSSGISGDKSEAGRGGDDYWIIKINESGSKLWDKTFGGNAADTFKDLLATTDGGYLLGGTSNSNLSGDKTEPGRTDGGTGTYWVIKVGANGNKLWDRTIYGEFESQLHNLAESPQGSYLLGGFADGIAFHDKTEEGAGYWLVNLDAEGKKIWDKLYGNYYDMQAVPNGYLLGGSYNPGSGDLEDYNLLKLDANSKVEQTIVFEPIPIKMYGQAPFPVKAKTNSGLPIVFSIASGPATIKDNIVTLTGPGVVVVKAIQTGNDVFKATEATTSITVEDSKYVLKEWDHVYFFSDYDLPNTLNDMVATPDGGALMIGTHYPESGRNPPARYFLAKIDNNGNTVWANPRISVGAGSIVASSDGNYLMASNVSHKIIKINASGSAIWEKDLGNAVPTGYTLNNGFTGLVLTPDGGFLLGAVLTSNTNNNDFYVIKIDANGNKQWNKIFGGSNNDDLTDIIITSDGGYLLGGISQSGISGDKTEVSRGGYDYWLIKLDASGNKQWNKTLGGSGQEDLSTLISMTDGSFLLGGTSYSGISGDKTAPNKGESDYWVIKINATGNKLWDRTYGGNSQDGLTTMVIAPDGNILLGGSSNSNISGDKTENTRGYYDYWTVKINSDGNKLWDKRLGSTYYDELQKIVVTTDEDYILGGVSGPIKDGDKTNTGARIDPYGSEIWLVKLTEDVPTRNPSIRLAPLADAYVQNGSSANTNYGSNTSLIVKGTTATNLARSSYLKFSLNNVSNVTSAKLRIYGSNIENSTPINLTAYGVTNDNWTETNITWNNAPTAAGAALSSVAINNQAQYYELDVTSFIQAQLAGDKTASFVLKDVANQNRSLKFNSKENAANPPQLILETTSVNLAPLADALVRNGSYAGTNYGNSTSLIVKGTTSSSLARTSYLKFSLNNVSNVGSATLRIYGSNVENSTPINLAAYGVTNDSWTENNITWNNAPTAAGTALSSVAVNNQARYYELDVTTFVQEQLAGDKTASFLLQDAANLNRSLVFNSKENTANPPQLILKGSVSSTMPAARINQPMLSTLETTAKSKVYPNPFSHRFTLQLSGQHAAAVSLKLVDELGRTYLISKRNMKEGESKTEVDISKLALKGGVYFLRISSASNSEVIRLLVE